MILASKSKNMFTLTHSDLGNSSILESTACILIKECIFSSERQHYVMFHPFRILRYHLSLMFTFLFTFLFSNILKMCLLLPIVTSVTAVSLSPQLVWRPRAWPAEVEKAQALSAIGKCWSFRLAH